MARIYDNYTSGWSIRVFWSVRDRFHWYDVENVDECEEADKLHVSVLLAAMPSTTGEWQTVKVQGIGEVYLSEEGPTLRLYRKDVT